jgi:hypothetical protein
VIEKIYDNRSNPLPLDCDKHIVDKAETSLVETMNGSLRGRIARFIRKTKASSKSFSGLCDAVLLWVYRDLVIENRVRYSTYCGRQPSNPAKWLDNGAGDGARDTASDRNEVAALSIQKWRAVPQITLFT